MVNRAINARGYVKPLLWMVQLLRQLPANELAGMMLASIGGLRLRKKSGHDGQVDSHPCTYVSSCDGVGRARETTADTSKLIPSRPV